MQFLGAARYTTGSKHLLEVNDKRILLDCGMVQGPRKIAERANRDLPLDAESVDAVVLSHAHIDHSGMLPRLVKMGFDGPIHMTDGTKSLIELLLFDSAHIQRSDARHLAKRGHHFEPYYDDDDVEDTLKQSVGHPYHTTFEVLPGVRVTFLDAGHILGSAIVVVDVDDGTNQRRITFTGDHGRKDLPILRDVESVPDDTDVLITESTYGDRLHESNPDMEKTLAEVVHQELDDGGRLLIPAFSVGRTQNVVLYLGNLMRSGRIPRIPIWVDSPLARKSTKVMAKYPQYYDDETRAILEAGRSPFFFDDVTYIESVDESKALNEEHHGIIVSASGMCEAGRIVHHLKRTVGNPKDCVLIVGYQAEGTVGRRLVEKYDRIRLFGKKYDVNCKVRSMGGFSAHADWREMIDAYGHLGKQLERTFVVHGEERPAMTHADRLEDHGFKNVHVPVKRERVVICG